MNTLSLQKWMKSKPSILRKVVFIHIPKTGGTTFRMVLHRLYPKAYHRCLSPSFDQVLMNMERFRCIEFHVAKDGDQIFYTHKDIMKKQNWKYLKDKDIFVMFRDPVNRVISAYFEKLRRSGGLQHSAETLKEYLSFHRTHNLQTGFLLGISPKGKIPDSRDLQSAKEMLRKLDIKIGILERYPESLQLLEAVTGKRIPNRTIKIENATDKGLLAEVDHATRESIKVKNSLDQELYAYAMELFEKQLKRIRSRGASEFEFQVPNP